MIRRPKASSVVAGLIVIFAATTAIAAECTVDELAGGDTCCFTNPRFSGVCQVTPGEGETCSDILAYLNNQASVGKTYCGNTKVRGGWSQVDCDSEQSTPRFEPEGNDNP
jgi:hypothetical protein